MSSMTEIQKRKNGIAWERIDEDTERLPVPGGWLVRSWRDISTYAGGGTALQVVFVAGDWALPMLREVSRRCSQSGCGRTFYVSVAEADYTVKCPLGHEVKPEG